MKLICEDSRRFLLETACRTLRLRESRLSQIYKVIIRVCVVSFISGEWEGTPLFELLNGKVTLNVLRSRLPRFKNCPKYLTTSNNIVLMQRTLEKRLSRTNNREFKIRRLRTTTTVKHGTAHDQNHVTVHFSRVVLRLR